ncbi:MAG TPA: dienelactone hydrolase family protein [Acidimicrobiales bacterium]|nr:dienelactone hydrolase family protein [Acidimicrobiales bacterium]
MCYGDDARPPLPPVRGGADDRGDMTLTAADGTELMAYYAHPDGPSDKGMIVLPDVRGLHHFYKELAVRFAEAGFHAVAIDYFARTADTPDRGEAFPFMDHVAQMKPETTDADIAAAAGWLRALPGSPVKSVFTIGFCMGGALSWRQSAAGQDLAGCIGFYGMPARVEDRVPDMASPLLMLAAGKDFTPVEAVEEFAAKVRERGVEVRLHVYPDAPHSFFDRSFEEHAEACADSWRQILDFTGVAGG